MLAAAASVAAPATIPCNLCAASIQGTDNAGVGWQREQIAAQARSRGRFGQL